MQVGVEPDFLAGCARLRAVRIALERLGHGPYDPLPQTIRVDVLPTWKKVRGFVTSKRFTTAAGDYLFSHDETLRRFTDRQNAELLAGREPPGLKAFVAYRNECKLVEQFLEQNRIGLPGTDPDQVRQLLDTWVEVWSHCDLFPEPRPHLGDIALDGLRAGILPVWVEGEATSRILIGFPVPGAAAPAKQSVTSPGPPKARTPVVLPPIGDLEPVPAMDWSHLQGLTRHEAARKLLRPLHVGAGTAAEAIIERICRQVSGLKSSGSGDKRRIQLELDSREGPQRLSLSAGFSGPLGPMPRVLAQIIRYANGIVLEGRGPEWFAYRGDKKRFAVEWGEWDLPDNTDGLWDAPPLAPFTDGQDLWAYHPAKRRGESLELVRIEHEGGTIVDEPEQHPGLCFLTIIADTL